MLAIFPSGPLTTNAYVLHCPVTKKAAIIDPAPESAEKIIAFIEKEHLIPEKLLFTHSHFDHIADAATLLKKYPIKSWIHELDAPNLIKPGSDGLPQFMPIEPLNPDFFLEEGTPLLLGNLKIEVIHTPGHSPGGVCFYLPEYALLIAGDTLFKGTIGNLSFPTAEPDLMWQSLKKLAKLDPKTKVYPGHGPSTTIGEEPWLKDAKNYFS